MMADPILWVVVDMGGILYLTTFAKEEAYRMAEKWNKENTDPDQSKYEVRKYVRSM